MNKNLLVLLLTCLTAFSVRADLIWYEGFNYPDGQIIVTSTNLANTVTNWVRHSGTAGNSFVINKRLEVATSRADDVNRKFPAAFTSSPTNLYASFTMSYTNPPTITNYIGHFIVGDTVFHGRVFSAPGTLANTWKLGITTVVSTIGLVKWLPVDLATNTPYQVVVNWDASQGINAVASIWVNPISTGDPVAVAGDTISPAPAASLGFGFRQAGGGVNTLLYVTNLAVGTTFDDAATNVWPAVAVTPAIVYSPKSGTNFSGSQAFLSGVANGQGLANMTYTWLKDGAIFTNPGGNTNTLIFPSAVPSDSGAYRLVATTPAPYSLSATSTVANLWVTNAPIPPSFVTQPVSTTVYFGQTATLTTSVTGPGTITYQWNHFGTNLPGEVNPSLSILNVQTNNGTTGAYTVGVTNEFGGILSSNAVVSAIPIPTASIAFLRTLVDPVTYNATNSTQVWQATGGLTFTNLTTGNTSSYYLQDGTAGINIFATLASAFRPAQGDVVTFVGVLSSFNSTLELVADSVNNPVSSFTVLSNNIPSLPAPRSIPFSITNNLAAVEALEGSLVMLTNVFFGTNAGNTILTNATTTVVVTNANGERLNLVFSQMDQNTAGQTLPSFAYTVVGVLAQNLNNATSPRNQNYNVTVTRFTDIVTNALATTITHSGGSSSLTWESAPVTYPYTIWSASAVTGPYTVLTNGLRFLDFSGGFIDPNASGSAKFYKLSTP